MANADQSPFQEIVDSEPFCQGDILHSDDGQNDGLGAFALIITADCDIAQGKDGGEFSVLRIVSAERYVRHIWAAAEARRLAKRQMKSALDALNAAINAKASRLAQLTPDSLVTWLGDDEPGEIVDAVGISGKAPRDDAARALHCVKEANSLGLHEEPIEALRRIWARLGTTDKVIRSRLSDVLDPARGAADMYFLPYVPEFAEIGFVVQLRHLANLSRDEVFPSKLDARIANNPTCFYRIGRLRDGIKYAAVQRMVNLYARVGLSEEYEQESSHAAEMVIENIHSYIKGS